VRRGVVVLVAATMLLSCARERNARQRHDRDTASDRTGWSDRLLVAADSLDIQALGTEPFWSVVVSRSRIVFSDPEHPGGQAFRFRGARGRTIGGWEFRGERDSIPREISIILNEQTCSDGMSDTRYPFASQVTLGDAVLRGCAREIARRD
jgi:uncharacterized membrane protein